MTGSVISGRVAGLVLALVLFGGCRSWEPLAIPTHSAELPIDDVRADRVLEQYLAEIATRSSLRGIAQVGLEGPDFQLDRPQRIAVARPDRLRFEVLGLFDQLAAMLVADGRDFGFYDASTGEITRGAMYPGLIWELARIDLDVEEIVGVLLGAPSPDPGTARAGVWLESDEELAVAFAWPRRVGDASMGCDTDPRRAALDPTCFLDRQALRRGGRIFVFDREGRLVGLRVVDSEGAIRYRVRFEDHRVLDRGGEGSSDGVRGDGASSEFAHRLRIHTPANDAEARFRWKRVMWAAELSDRIFRIP